ncbi:hypothetical protein LEMLEM_LOCUS2732 [Lemmus lemmus]
MFEEDLGGDEALKHVKVCANSIMGRGNGQCDNPERGCAWQLKGGENMGRLWSQDDKESPPRERLENRAPQEASAQERPPDKRPVCFYSARHQSSRRWEQGPEGTQDDPTGKGEVSGPIPQALQFQADVASGQSTQGSFHVSAS